MQLLQLITKARVIILLFSLACIVATSYFGLPYLSDNNRCLSAHHPLPPAFHWIERLPEWDCHQNDSIADNPSNPIPRILHYVFKNHMPFESYRELIRGCLQLNPNWTVFLWRDSDAERLIREQYRYFAAKYNSYRDRLEKSDSVRYIILHRIGGIYLDMDVQCLRPFDHLLRATPAVDGVSAFLGEERREQTRILYGYSYYTMNSLMGATPGHPFLRFVIDRMLTMPDLNHARLSTGPDLLTHAYQSWVGNFSQSHRHPQLVTALPARLVSPLIDTWSVNWVKKCEAYFKPTPNPENLDPIAQAWKRRGCAELVAKGWQFDDTDNATIAIHRFLHLGYGNQERMRTFNLLSTFARIKTFY